MPFIEAFASCPRCSISIKTFNERDVICDHCQAIVAWQGSVSYLPEPELASPMSLPKFTCVVAADHHEGIGLKGDLPWPRIPADMKFFRLLTEGRLMDEKVARLAAAYDGFSNAVIMGRKTWESLPPKFRPLPNRNNIVLSRTLTLNEENFSTKLFFCREGLSKALELAASLNAPEIFVIGGGEVYAEAIVHPSCARIYVTRVLGTFEADTFMPNLTLSKPPFSCRGIVEEGEHNGLHYQIQKWEPETGNR